MTELRRATIFQHGIPDLDATAASEYTLADLTEKAQILAYLKGHCSIVVARSMHADVLNPALVRAVRTVVYTDGAWTWSADAAYYLENYNLVTDHDLIQHIRTRHYTPTPLSPDQIAVALEAYRDT
jgi:hypothetical protein